WTYMQIALNYGSAIYYDKAILSVADAQSVQSQPAKSLEELAPILINDLLPYKDVPNPNLGLLFGYSTSYSYFPVRFVLGDLYLWTGQYENAAQEYYDLINKNSITMSSIFSASWEVVNNAFTGVFNIYNSGYLGDYPYSQMTNIGATNQYGQNFQLDSLTINKTLTPTPIALRNWDSQVYSDITTAHTLYRNGDFRKYGSVSYDPKGASFDPSDTASVKHSYYIAKYLILNPFTDTYKTDKRMTVYRTTLLYLRYAEALNRLNKPNAAFAVMKYGLNSSNLFNRTMIPRSELNIGNIKTTVFKSSTGQDSIVHDTTFVVPPYMNFVSSKFDANVGIRARSLGTVKFDKVYYIIPKLPSMQDSVLFVEDKIQQELALETAFEGNRFQDLMRIAIRRNDNSYLANIVAKKYTANKEAIRAKLMNRANWYVPKQ
ncbi:MAG: hypothetical protein BGN96_15970, partial [Bacteroidales bacterium 45-6]